MHQTSLSMPQNRQSSKINSYDGSIPHRCSNNTTRTQMTRALPFTEISLARAIRGVERAGRFVIGVKGDGTLIVGDKPVETASLIPQVAQDAPTRRFGEKLGGQSAT